MKSDYTIDMLVNSNLSAIGRATDLVWYIFEKDNMEFSLHTQCAWRLLKDGYPILTSSGIYYVKDEDENNGSDLTLFDHIVMDKIKALLPVSVKEVKRTDINDLLIIAENGIKIEIFADQPDGFEQWRFFLRREGVSHLVAYTDRCDYE